MTASEILVAEAVYYRGNWKAIVDAINQKKILPVDDIIRINKSIRCKTLTILDKDYPEYLKELYQPPLVLFYYGDISLINNPKTNLAIVGTRKPSEVGADITKQIIAHKETIDNGGKTIAVLGCGIDICYPTKNKEIYEEIKKNHLLVSEYPGITPPSAENFPFRNRLIAQFSKAILVTESKKRSGSSITVMYGLCYGRDVMCVPSTDYGNSGCNSHIRDGATLVENAKQVIEMME